MNLNYWRVLAWALITFETVSSYILGASIFMALFNGLGIWAVITLGVILNQKDMALGRDAE